MSHIPIQQKNDPLITKFDIKFRENWNFYFIGKKSKMTHTTCFRKLISPKDKVDKTLCTPIKPANTSVRMAYKGQNSLGNSDNCII